MNITVLEWFWSKIEHKFKLVNMVFFTIIASIIDIDSNYSWFSMLKSLIKGVYIQWYKQRKRTSAKLHLQYVLYLKFENSVRSLSLQKAFATSVCCFGCSYDITDTK